ncbi:MAG: energy transducer TonB [Verrucomicrobiales bacterium]
MYEDDEEEKPTFTEKYRSLLVVAVLLVVGGGLTWILMKGGDSAPSQRSAPQMVTIVAPPPPRPTPPPTPAPTPPPVERDLPEPEMIMQDALTEEDLSEAPDQDASDEPESEPLGTGIVGDGPADGFGLGRSGGGGMIGGRRPGGGGGTRFGRYAAMVQNRVSEAMRSHPQVKSSTMRIEVRVWADDTGRITRAQLVNSTGDPSLDRTMRDDLLTGLRLAEPPPEDMPMPIVMRLSASRP